MNKLSEKYFRPAKFRAVIENGKLRIIILDGGMGYIGNVEIKVWNKLDDQPIIVAEFTPNIVNGVIKGTLVPNITPPNTFTEYLVSANDGGEGYSVLPQIIVTPNQEVLDWSEFSLRDLRRRPFAFFLDSLGNLPDSPNAPTGARVTLTTSAFDIKWDDLTFAWDDIFHVFNPAQFRVVLNETNGSIFNVEILDGGEGYIEDPSAELVGGDSEISGEISLSFTNGRVTGVNIIEPGEGYKFAPEVRLSGGVPVTAIHTWDTLGFGNYYEMEWLVWGPRKFHYKIRGRVDDLREHQVILPFVGMYDVELRLYDTANTVNNLFKKEFIEVVIPNVNFAGFYRHRDKIDSWDDMTKPWNELMGTWINPMYQTRKLDDLTISWDDYRMENFYPVGIEGVPKNRPIQVLDLNETDISIGNILNVFNDTIVLTDSKINPAPQVGELVYLRVNNIILQDFIKDAPLSYFKGGINGISGDIENEVGDTQFGIKFNHLSNNFVGDERLPEYIVENPETTEIYVEPKITTTVGGTLDLTDIKFAVTKDIEIYSEDHGFDPNWSESELIDFITNVILIPDGNSPVSKYYFPFYILDDESAKMQPIPGQTGQCLWVEVNPADILTDTSLTGRYGIVRIKHDAEIIPDPDPNKFDPNAIYSFPPNIKGFRSWKIDSDSPWVVEPLDLEFSRHNLITRTICNFSDINYIILDSGEWMYYEPIFFDENHLHRVTGVLDKSIVELSIKIQNSEYLSRIGPGWEVLRKLKNTILLQGEPDINIGDWLEISPKGNEGRQEGIKIYDFDLNGAVTAIFNQTLTNLDNKRIEIYRRIDFDDVIIKYMDLDLQKISLDFESDVTFLYETMQTLVYDEININDNRFIILGVEFGESNEELVLELKAIDSPLSWIDENFTLAKIRYKWYRFITKVYQTSYIGGFTRVVFDFNFWVAPTDFVDTIQQYLDNSPHILPDDWFIDLNILNGIGSVKIMSKGKLNGNTLVTVEDKWNDLWNCRIDSIAKPQYYNRREVLDRIGVNQLTWDSFKNNNVSWDDLEYFTWNMFHYTHAKVPVFKITKAVQGGKIKWNDEPEFEFTEIKVSDDSPITTLTQLEVWQLALKNLKESDNSGIQRFNFSFDDENLPNYILGVAKTIGSDGLGQVVFRHGVEGEYSFDPSLSHTYPDFAPEGIEWVNGSLGVENQNPWWDHTTQVYMQGVNPEGLAGWYPKEKLPRVYQSENEQWRGNRIPYLPAVSGDISLDEMRYFNKGFVTVPKLTTTFLVPTTNIKGKVKWTWEIWKGNTKIIDYIGEYFSWTFFELGNYDIKLIIEDNKGNIKQIVKHGIIKVEKEIKI